MQDQHDNPERYKVGDVTYDASAPVLTMAVDETSGSESCATFVLGNEDHSLGNALRWMVSKDPRVEFCGYAMPHPSEKKVNLRIQTRNDVSAKLVLRDALRNVTEMCDLMSEKFIGEASSFRAAEGLVVPRYDGAFEEEEEEEEEEEGEEMVEAEEEEGDAVEAHAVSEDE